MSAQGSWEEIEQACRDVGLPAEMLDRLGNRLRQMPLASTATPREEEIMKLIGTSSVDRLVHDVRNLLNELALLRAVADLETEGS